MTQIWMRDLDESVYTDATIADVRSFIGVPLSSGRSLDGRFPADTAIELLSGDTYADFVTAGPMVLVSAKLKSIMENHDVNAEFFAVATDTGAEMYFCNFLETLDCLNRDRSSFTSDGDFATNIERLELDANDTEPPVYRVAMTIPVVIAVRDDVAKAIESEDVSGMIFRSPKDWTNPMYPS